MPDQDDAVIWLRPEATGRGRVPGYSRAQIAKAAIAVADAEGLEAASMRRVATEIGAGPMSLYRYVRNKDELHLLMTDEVLHQDWPRWATMPEPDWEQTLRRMAHNLRALVLSHPWWAEVMMRGPVFGPTIMRMVDRTLAGLDGLGLDIDEMMDVTEIIRTFAIGHAQQEHHAARAMAATGSADLAHMRPDWMPYIMSVIESGELPYVRRVVLDASTPHETDSRVLFERGLGRIIAGIAATLPAA
ncbi:TetR/AcrR family transcriptional regulator C-terminal domain-containing protein [Catenulispora sp. NF23]|uniref:TetR/AcrR family transcriptional regulator n=1 Tax=Catenulispora pinistramenti TaxID=2705254 RepID=UPI001BA4C1B4|nr:TetR/AcrR family transcriptional regulator [Catenulispora pinistramenti]MBS2532544.1 TetR/AcrR family transcriptional regulator C-terminal domain-containing protein [Catenulispora pinistramenti]